MSEGAFLREKEREMFGALKDWWYAYLRAGEGGRTPDAELRAKAERLALAGERPPPYYSE